MKEKHMDITLKQNEIDQAIRRYVAETVGVNLTGKRLGISYSATRGTAGITASLTIEDIADVQIPGFTDRNADPEPSTDAPKANVLTLAAAPNTIGAAIAGTVEVAADPVVTAEDPTVEVAAETVEGAVATPAKSGLFAD